MELTQEIVRRLLDYDPETGTLWWKQRTPDLFKDGEGMYSKEAVCRRWNKKHLNKEAFTSSRFSDKKKTYKLKQGTIFGRSYKAHRIIWLWWYGYWATFIDHQDGNPLNNRLANLREVTRSENQCNSKIPSHNTSGVMGVGWAESMNKWRAYIQKEGKVFVIGYSSNFDEAVAMRKAKESELGFHPNHGRSNVQL